MTNTYLDLIRALGSWVFILPAAHALGLRLDKLIPFEDRIARGITRIVLGFSLLSTGVVLLSCVKLITPASIWSLLILSCLAGGVSSLRELKNFFSEIHRIFWLNPPDRASRIFSLFYLAMITVLFFGAMTPEIGGDSLCYHLNLPKLFLRQRHLAPVPYDENSFFPLYMTNLYLIGLATGGMYAAKLFSFIFGVFLTLIAHRAIYRLTQSQLLSTFGAMAILLTPGIYNQLSTTYVDVTLGMFTLLSLLILLEAIAQERPKYFFTAGALAGCGLAIKYLSLISLIPIMLLLIFYFIRTSDKNNFFTGIVLFGLSCIAFCGPSLIRNWIATGNPLYPYLGELFTGAAQRPPIDYYDLGNGKTIPAFLALFWNMFSQPGNFGGSPDRIGVFYFLAQPFIVWSFIRMPKTRVLVFFSFVFLLLWFRAAQASRWLYPLLPFLIIISCAGFQSFVEGLRAPLKPFIKYLIKIPAVLLLLFYALAGAYHYRYAGMLWLGQWTSADYLRKLERTYPPAEWLNINIPPNSKILSDGEVSKFYFAPEIIDDSILDWQTAYKSQGWNDAQLAQWYKSKGFTHLLIRSLLGVNVSHHGEPADAKTVSASQFVTLLHQIDSENIRDQRYTYRIYTFK